MTARILIATSMAWPFPAQLAGAFAAAGAHVEALRPQAGILAVSRHPARHHPYRTLAPMESLCEAIAYARADMIVSCDDLVAGLVGRTCGVSLPGRGAFLAQAKAAGAPAVESLAIPDEAGLDRALVSLGLPLVLKTDHSWGGEGVAIVADRAQARAAFHRFAHASRLRDLTRAVRGRGAHFLARALDPVAPVLSAQRFIAGSPATSSIACWQGTVVAAHHFDVLVSTTPTSPASVVRQTDCPQMADAARAVAQALNLSGLFGLDYVRDRQGQVHLLEMNARATPTMHLALAADPVAALLQAAGWPARSRPPVTQRREIALFPREILRDAASPWFARAHHDVPWDDPAVVKACVRACPPAARALLARDPVKGALTPQSPVFNR